MYYNDLKSHSIVKKRKRKKNYWNNKRTKNGFGSVFSQLSHSFFMVFYFAVFISIFFSFILFLFFHLCLFIFLISSSFYVIIIVIFFLLLANLPSIICEIYKLIYFLLLKKYIILLAFFWRVYSRAPLKIEIEMILCR